MANTGLNLLLASVAASLPGIGDMPPQSSSPGSNSNPGDNFDAALSQARQQGTGASSQQNAAKAPAPQPQPQQAGADSPQNANDPKAHPDAAQQAQTGGQPAQQEPAPLPQAQDVPPAANDGETQASQAANIDALLKQAFLLLQALAAAIAAPAQPAAQPVTAGAANTGAQAIADNTGGAAQDPLAELLALLAKFVPANDAGAPPADTSNTAATAPGDPLQGSFAQLLQPAVATPAPTASDLRQIAALLTQVADTLSANIPALPAAVAPVTPDILAIASKLPQPVSDTALPQAALAAPVIQPPQNASQNMPQNTPQPAADPALFSALKQVADKLAQVAQAVSAPKPEAAQANAKPLDMPVLKTTADAPHFLNITAAPDASLNSDGSGQNDANTGGDQTGKGLFAAVPTQAPDAGAQAGSNAPAGNTTFAQLVNQPPQVAQGSPAEQMVAYVRAAAAGGNSHIQVQLHPADLGTLDIRLSVNTEGHATLNVTADNPKTLGMLQSDTKQLTQMLTDVGLKADAGSLSFNLRGDGQPGQQWQGQGGQPYSGYVAPAADPLEELLAAAPTQTYTVAPADGVNIIT